MDPNMYENRPESEVTKKDYRDGPKGGRRAIVQAGKSPSIPKKFFLICLLGVLLIMIGLAEIFWSFFVDYYCVGRCVNPAVYGWFVAQMGGLTLALGFLSAGFLAKNISQNTRTGLILATALTIGLFTIFPQSHAHFG
jgi:hypothetical protein